MKKNNLLGLILSVIVVFGLATYFPNNRIVSIIINILRYMRF